MRKPSPNRPYRYEALEVDASREAAFSAWRWFVLVFCGLIAVLAFVRLRSSNEELRLRVETLRRDYDVRAKELENLELEYESYTGGRYVFGAVARMNLGLRPPEPGQVRRVSVGALPSPAPGHSGEASGLVARN
ncbi:MAG: hypothetical protein BWZ02_00352 [Lentisphaerae bacterium ADurb.BinA184]|nr:MAG: hypothetical protein BWZ02_00352 [Lentisphaerae bacterium ADurb.BinA184]